MDLNLDFSSILSGISSSGTLEIIINALSNANATIHLEMISGTLHLSSTIDFDHIRSNSLPAMIQILPFSGGIDTFLLRLVSSLFESLLPDLIEYAIEELKSIPFYTGMSIGAMIEDMLVQLELWNSELNMGNFENFCTNPGDYLKQGNRIINLINSAVSHVYAILQILMEELSRLRIILDGFPLN